MDAKITRIYFGAGGTLDRTPLFVVEVIFCKTVIFLLFYVYLPLLTLRSLLMQPLQPLKIDYFKHTRNYLHLMQKVSRKILALASSTK